MWIIWPALKAFKQDGRKKVMNGNHMELLVFDIHTDGFSIIPEIC